MISQKGPKKRRQRYASFRHTLEARMLYDASLVVAPHDAAATADADAATTDAAAATTDAANSAPAATTDHSGLNITHSAATVPAQAPSATSAAETQKDINKNAVSGATAVTDATASSTADTSLAASLQEFMAFQTSETSTKEIAFIDASLKDQVHLLEGLPDNAEIHFISGSVEEALNQIKAELQSENTLFHNITIITREAGNLSDGMQGSTDSLRAQIADDMSEFASIP